MQAIVAERVSKTYRVRVGRARVREMLPWPVDKGVRALLPSWWMRDTMEALADVSFSVASGTSVGLVGHNGAGKTTLLKVISGVTAPSAGGARAQGRIAALIDLVVGFHPDLTGRENMFLLGAMHGVNKRTVMRRLDDILEFAEIDGDLVDTPVKRFSAGMNARLGFATITAIEPEILLVDEVLAVGDAAFQRKSVGWLDAYQAKGGTLLFVSHNLGLVRSMTERTIWLDHGRLVDDDRTPEVLARYAKAMERRDSGSTVHRKKELIDQIRKRGLDRWGVGDVRLESVHVAEPSPAESRLDVDISYETSGLDSAVFYVGFLDEAEREIGAAASPQVSLTRGRGVLRCTIQPLPFNSGIYFPVVLICSAEGVVQDRWRLDRAIVVDQDGRIPADEAFGPVHIASSWRRDPGEQSLQ